ncbi:hypothetical protein VCV18_005482 [Metarhizium anisopliae]
MEMSDHQVHDVGDKMTMTTRREETRETQRLKRDRSRERSPAREARTRPKTPPAPAKEVVRSGSEEGEIEE